ncbi:MAG: septal ring lytic transglycosylase RlpA family protein [Bacteroidaceae bacterium]|nr:septal ring lytic transglycosylase RlpA family protein [Bacteroidaceae bacterium]
MQFKTILLTLFSVMMLATTAGAQSETKTGYATFYGYKWHGRKTADGSILHNDSMTCAHKTLPFGTLLHVRNPKNGKEVVVRVNDRGPFRPNTEVDLSMAAAEELDMIRAGVVKVEITKVGTQSKNGKVKEFTTEMELLDPATGKYYTLHEWQERAKHRRELAKAKRPAASQQRSVAQNKSKNYRVRNNKATARAKR